MSRYLLFSFRAFSAPYVHRPDLGRCPRLLHFAPLALKPISSQFGGACVAGVRRCLGWARGVGVVPAGTPLK